MQPATILLEADLAGRHLDEVDVIDLELGQPVLAVDLPGLLLTDDDGVGHVLDLRTLGAGQRHGQHRQIEVIAVETDHGISRQDALDLDRINLLVGQTLKVRDVPGGHVAKGHQEVVAVHLGVEDQNGFHPNTSCKISVW